ncbi:hypothetical protein PIB30_058717 [Stylosanthes scabra]|uniref:(+)-delta-cadinene synthase n=1 Tax=Stylosanthes scabra TaxID=79078 RepID=A0ABU6RL50_9FABA|nr:hypothetical protein [Stylosanthes scabra]
MQEFDHETKSQIETLKKEVAKMLIDVSKPISKVNLIDLICHLGIQYHFETEIDEDVNANFNEELVKDVDGLVELYEASHLRIHGEDILDEAYAFTSIKLKSISTKLSPSLLIEQVKYSLSQSYHQGLARLEARRFISIYEQYPTHNETLLTLAKLDFNFLQNLHRKEVYDICKWWKELDIVVKLPYARDRIVECYNWILAVYFEPQYSRIRKILTKLISVLSIVDDTYDLYGTIDELKLFTHAIERWHIGCLNNLPEYMKLIYESLFKIYEEAEQELGKHGRAYCIKCAIKELQKTIQVYMTEAKWLKNNYIPTMAEYIQTSAVSSGYPILITISFIGMGDMATEDIFKWVTSKPKMVRASAIMCRIMDDIVSNEFEQKREHVASILECYIKEFDVSKEEAIQEMRKRVTYAWKDMNKECLKPTAVPMPFLTRILNMSRFMDVMYKDEDCYTHAEGKMKKCIEALLVNPVPIILFNVIGHSFSEADHIQDIIDSLPNDYDGYVVSVMSRLTTFTIHEAESFLLAFERRITKKTEHMVVAHLTQTNLETNQSSGRGNGGRTTDGEEMVAGKAGFKVTGLNANSVVE